MEKVRKPQFDTAEGRMLESSWQNYCDTAEPPKRCGLTPLTTVELKHYRNYLRAKPVWRESDFPEVHKLVRLDSRIRKLLEDTQDEPAVIYDVKGNPKANPCHSIFSQLNNAAIAMRRALGLAGEAPSFDCAYKPVKARNTRGGSPSTTPADKDDRPAIPANLLHLP